MHRGAAEEYLNAVRLAAPMVAAFFWLIATAANAADGAWQIRVAGGALVLPSGVMPNNRDVEPRLGDEITDTNFDEGAAWAAGIGYRITPNIELGARFEQGFPTFNPRYIRTRTPGTAAGSIIPVLDSNLDFLSATVGPRVYFRDAAERLQPFLEANVGWYRGSTHIVTASCVRGLRVCQNPDPQTNDDTEDGFGLNAGGGVDVHVTGPVSAGIDIRYEHAWILGNLDYVTTMAVLTVGF